MSQDIEDFVVVVNDEAQYSLWSARKPPPVGWRAQGAPGSREACLTVIGEVWRDLRPASLRRDLGSAT
jgi:MbtH protein